ncbi:hypothetical protein [Azohydromonas aeria]|uniref:hypothetical protein n=1 Tax=Azohydromonas aeria TaxID=2590212 RepID=UPI0012F72DC8|nr:hypothetical protein [Azohydromonas aeria]
MKRFPRSLGLCTGVAVSVAACTPALNWREVRLDGGAVALFPCKPQHQTRTLALDGQPVALTLHACEAAGLRFAVARADVQEPARVEAALAALAAAQARNLQATLPAGEPVQVPGMTPNAQARRYALTGRRPDGSGVQAQLLLFARGTQVLQATVLDAAPDAPAVHTFMEALRASG